jgi:hypothetical protein
VAAITAFVVLAVYVLTLAPTVTFWDAGEFITAARTLGIPHPPGTPLFVLLANVWGRVLPFGEYAWRQNLLSAVCGAVAAGCWFLVGHDIIRRTQADADRVLREKYARLGGIAAAALAAFGFTIWQNSNETEVYAAAMLVFAITAWLATRWRAVRESARAPRLMLAALYLVALSIGIHPMGMLAGPALIVMFAIAAWREPAADPIAGREEWARVAVFAAAWVLIVGAGTGNVTLGVGGIAAMAAALVLAQRARQLPFAAIAIVIVAVGASTLAFLWLRAQQHPWLDQGMPSTWHGLVSVVRRAQYAPRTPFDDPTVPHGPANPGRTLTLLAYQLANYVQYFDWQWAAGLGEHARASIPRLGVTLLMLTIGIRGAFAHRRADVVSFALVSTIFLVAGPGLVLYLNFKPGPSIGWDRWAVLASHEVRDRDYFFAASFVAWGIWVAIGLVDLARDAVLRVTARARAAASATFAIALIPLALNFRAATRRQTPEATFARDFAHALLQSVPPNGVLFTWGDNDTFPLWYAQQVEAFRPDVSVVCLSLAQALWYVKLVRDQPHAAARQEDLAPVWRDTPIIPVNGPLHGIDDAAIDAFRPFRTGGELALDLGERGVARIPAGGVVTPADITVSEVLRTNAGRRPIAWSLSAADALYGLGPRLVQTGMVLVMPIVRPDSSTLVGGAAAGPGGAPLDLPTTRRLIDETWNFGRLEIEGSSRLDGNIQAVAATIATPMVQSGNALLLRGDTAGAVRLFERAVRIADDSVAKEMLVKVKR